MQKLFLIILLNAFSLGAYTQFVDLGLPSGNLWKTENESGYFEFDEANAKYQDQLPCYGDWKELVDVCKWEWTGDGYMIIGPNGNSINLPAAGGQACNGEWYEVGTVGNYWTSSPAENELGWQFWILSGNRNGFADYHRSNQSSVRLIQNR